LHYLLNSGSTDFIVEYPTETYEDFEDTKKLFDELKPQKVNITSYSARPNTPASRLHDLHYVRGK
jgi:threonylcarbamoyladenosine tRNA methylthiotransferase CDKAL1